MTDQAKITSLKHQLETLTGKLVTFRNRDTYRAGQAKAQRERRKRLKKEKS